MHIRSIPIHVLECVKNICIYLQRITRLGAKGIKVPYSNFGFKNSYPSSRCSCILCILYTKSILIHILEVVKHICIYLQRITSVKTICIYLQRIRRLGAKRITVQYNNFDDKNSYPSSRCSCIILCILKVS